MESIPKIYISIILGNFALFNLFYAWAIYRRDYSVIDIAWGAGFFLATLLFAITELNMPGQPIALGTLMLTGLVLLWSSRLTLFLSYRKYHHSAEDWRYQEIRKKQGAKSTVISYFTIFMLQMILQLVFLIPIVETLRAPKQEILWLIYLAVTVTLFGIVYEAVADWQKFSFKQNYPTQPMTSGLWRYSRHANYFGEIVTWIGFFLFSIAAGTGHIGIAGPILITFLLLKVSGVPLISNHNQQKSEYQNYYKNTNMILPWPAKKVRK
jgi:steroid 5-alpha reductase family enzyme